MTTSRDQGSPTAAEPPSSGPARGEAWLLTFACVLPTLITLVYFRLAEGWPAALQQGAYLAGKALQFGLPIVWCGWVLREKLGFVRGRANGLVLGVLFGLAVAAVTWFGYALWLGETAAFQAAAGRIRERVSGIGVGSPWAFAGLAVFYSLCHSLLEEYYWRWFVFRRLKSVAPLGWSVAVSAIAFAAHHVVILDLYFGEAAWLTALLSVSVAVGGVVWAWLYHHCGTLLAPWVSHLLVDAAIFAVGFAVITGG